MLGNIAFSGLVIVLDFLCKSISYVIDLHNLLEYNLV